MNKAKIFSFNKTSSKNEAELNQWLAQNPKVKILCAAGTQAYFTLIYEE